MYQKLFELQAKTLKALAHSRRLEIVQLLQKQELSVTDIYKMLDLPQANVSQHLATLREANILVTRNEGKQHYYKVADTSLLNLISLLREYTIKHNKKLSAADEFTLTMQELIPLTHDPVCHMRVSPKTAGFAHKHNGKAYYFCASGCLKQFRESPDNFID